MLESPGSQIRDPLAQLLVLSGQLRDAFVQLNELVVTLELVQVLLIVRPVIIQSGKHLVDRVDIVHQEEEQEHEDQQKAD